MRTLLQRVTHASVSVDEVVVGRIGAGLVVLLGVGEADSEKDAAWLAQKVVNLRIFDDESGRFDRSLRDVQGQVLVVSQFTLYGDARRGRRPSFTHAAPPKKAETLVNSFCRYLAQEEIEFETGQFGAHMLVDIHNDGPVTIWLDTDISRRGNVKP